jgi:VWFA-related protein
MRFPVFLLIGAAFGQQQTLPTIKVPVRLVMLETLVFSARGEALSGLEKKDFQVLDNSRAQNFRFESGSAKYSLAILIQTSQSVRSYLPFIEKVGSTIENSLQAQTGETAVLTYEDDVTVRKRFGTGDLEAAVKSVSVGGEKARLFDAARAISLLSERESSRSKILVIIGQPFDNGSDTSLQNLIASLEQQNISVFALTLPLLDKSFISDSFSLQGLGSQKGGFVASVELTKLGPVLKRIAKVKEGSDPFTLLTHETGGLVIHFRKQSELENAVIAFGGALHGAYTLSYSPESPTTGRHSIVVSTDVPGAVAYTRPSYEIKAN